MSHIATNDDRFLCWIHFGDLHITERTSENFDDFLALVDEANRNLADDIDFVFFPGDNADDGTEAQFAPVREGLDKLRFPAHIITGDHDRASGSLHAFRRLLEPELYRARTLRGFRLLFLNALDGDNKDVFDLGDTQMSWLRSELIYVKEAGLRPLIFTHLYPSELRNKGVGLSKLIRQNGVELVEMGHTHYNELANDGHTIYVTTRSTGQIEEGPPGFSFTAIDGDVISWKFKERGHWPVVLITSPADRLLITSPESAQHIVRGLFLIRAKTWGAPALQSVTAQVDGQSPIPMEEALGHWQLSVNSETLSDGIHKLSVLASTMDERIAGDEIEILVSQSRFYVAPPRSAIDYENAIAAHPAKRILGTQLGPNENGTKGPWPSWRKPTLVA